MIAANGHVSSGTATGAFREVFAMHRQLELVEKDIELLMRRDNQASEGAIMTLTGVPGSGKTRFVQRLVARHPRIPHGVAGPEGSLADHLPVAVAAMPDTGVGGLATAILNALTGAEAPRGRQQEHQETILHYAKEMRTRLVVIEEAHNVFRAWRKDTALRTTTLLKDLCNRGDFGILLVGLDQTYDLIRSDEELKRRLLSRRRIKPLSWEKEIERTFFRTLLVQWSNAQSTELGPCNLGGETIARKIHLASGGVLGLAAKLVERASMNALAEPAMPGETLDGVESRIVERHLHDAYELVDMGDENPFLSYPDERRETLHPAAADATTAKRSGTRRAGRTRNFRP